MDLRHGDEKIMDIGLKYGYDSSKAFSVAFKRFHGKRPSDVRKGGDYRVFTPIYFALTMKGGNNIDIKIVKKPTFTLGGLQVHNKGGTDFGKLWDQLFEKFDEEELKKLGNGKIYGSCFEVLDSEDFWYMAGFDIEDKEKAKEIGLKLLEVPEGNYAIIPCKGPIPQCIHKGWKYVMEVFLPQEGLKHSGAPDFEVYGMGDPQSEDYKMELWIPVVKE